MKTMDGALLKRCLAGGYRLLDQKKEEVNILNVFPVPDGDTGTNMSLTMQSAIKQIESVKSDRVSDVGKALGMGSLMGARGNSGVILSQLCRGIADAVKGKDVVRLEDFQSIFFSAKEKAYKAVMKPTEGTILTVARSFSEFVEANISQISSIPELLQGVLAYGNYTLQKTPDMLPALKEAGVVDAGGQGLVYLLAGFLAELTGLDSEELLQVEDLGPLQTGTTTGSVSSHLYRVEAELAEAGQKQKDLEKKLSAYAEGLSLDERGENLLVEYQTDHLEKSLKAFLSRYEIISLRVENLQREAAPEPVEKKTAEEKKDLKKYGFVTVSLGQGFNSIFEGLLVDQIVSGGQTMNPSTQDLYEAVERVDAENVFIFPNNKNIIMAADQVKDLTEKNVIVIPTRSIPQGFTALFNFDDQADPEENRKQMTESADSIITGQITYAVRDTEINGLKIKKDDYIGLINDQIVQTGQDRDQLLLALLEKYVNEEASLVTVYAGDGIEEEGFNRLAKKVENCYSDLDVDFEFGNQPTYFYIFSIE